MLAAPIPENETERLAALYELHILDTPPIDRFDRITRVCSAMFGVPITLVSLVDANRQWFKSKCGLDAQQTPRDVSFCGHAILQDDALVIHDALLDPRFNDNPFVTGDPKIRFYAGHPLSVASGHKIGTLCLIDHEPREFGPRERELLRDLARVTQDEIQLVDIVELQQDLRRAKAEIEEANRSLERGNRFIRQVLGSQMSDAVAEKLMESPDAMKLGGETREVTILMADLRGFTPLAEKLPAERTVDMLNRFMGAVIDVILKCGGTVDQIVGDGLLAIFGAPATMEDAAARAVRCAVEMQHSLKEVNALNARDGLPALEMGIGISTGEVVVGNIGSSKRMKYSVIGTPVNLASRIESLALGGQILISEATRAEIGDLFAIVGSLRVKIKGIAGSVSIFDVGYGS